MQEHINKGKHNEDFHKCIDEKFPNKFYDWKITCLFYAAIHYLKALAAKKGKIIGDTHAEINNNVNPYRSTRVLDIEKDMWDEYFNLYQCSRTSRYDGFIDSAYHDQIMKDDYTKCKRSLTRFKLYLKGHGITIK